MNGHCQFLNVTRSRRRHSTEPSADPSRCATGTDLQHPLSVRNLTHGYFKHCGTTAAPERPAAIPPIVHLIGIPPSPCQFRGQLTDQCSTGRVLPLFVCGNSGGEPKILRNGHGAFNRFDGLRHLMTGGYGPTLAMTVSKTGLRVFHSVSGHWQIIWTRLSLTTAVAR